MTHTPGPWVVGGPYPKITVCQPAAFDDPWIPIAEVWPSVDHEASDEVKANAALIAAAPDMLDTLKEIDEYFDTVFHVGSLMSDAEIHLRSLVKLRLAKVGE